MKTIWPLCVLLLVTAMQPARALTGDDLKKQLLPAPHTVEVRGQARPLPAGNFTLFSTLSQGMAAFDPARAVIEAAKGRRITRRTLPLRAANGPVYALVLLAGNTNWSPQFSPAQLNAARALGPEGYLLETFPSQGTLALIVGGGPRGLLYGAQTLGQLLSLHQSTLSPARIADAPDFSVRELHIHGFDKGYGAGDFKSLTAYTQLLPTFWPDIARARYNLFRFSMDAGWITDADRWIKDDIDAVMKRTIADARAQGVDVLVEVRFDGQRANSQDIDFYPLNPITEWPVYEKALRRALRWGPDVIDLSFNDLRPVTYPDVLAKYGVDGRFSGVLMAELLHKAQAIIKEEKPGTRLYHLPRFYGDVHWKQYPRALPELAANAPRGVTVYTTSSLLHPDVMAAREKHGTPFIYWQNYTSNHAKELKVLLSAPAGDDLKPWIEKLPAAERRALINLGYPIEPQRAVVPATGEMLWHNAAYDTQGSLAKAARRVWGAGPDALFLQYARLLDFPTVIGSLGLNAAAIIDKPKAAADEEVSDLKDKETEANLVAKWEGYHSRAVQAAQVAQRLEQSVADAGLRRTANILFWNAERVRIDSQIGVLLATSVTQSSRLNTDAIEKLLREEEAILKDKYPVESNDPKSAEVSTRGIRRIRAALKKAATPGSPKTP